jgi:hypothetical protein
MGTCLVVEYTKFQLAMAPSWSEAVVLRGLSVAAAHLVPVMW